MTVHVRDIFERLTSMVVPLQPDMATERVVRSCAVVEPSDVVSQHIDRSEEALLIVAYQGPSDELLDALRRSRPALVVIKGASPETAEDLARAAAPSAVAIAQRDIPWLQLHALIAEIIRVDQKVSAEEEPEDPDGTELPTDLFDLATTLATQLGGYVSIDDSHSRVLAFSPLDEHADEIRRNSILGRSAPPGHREELRAMGVWRRLRQGEIVELPETEMMKARLAIGVLDEASGGYLGTIWVQRGFSDFPPRSRQFMRSAGIVVARTLRQRQRVAARADSALTELLGLSPRRESRFALTSYLGLGSARSWVLCAFRVSIAMDDRFPGAQHSQTIELAPDRVSRHAMLLRTQETLYVLLPDPDPGVDLTKWAERAATALSVAQGESVVASVGPRTTDADELPVVREYCDALLTTITPTAPTVREYDRFRFEATVGRLVNQATIKGYLTGEPVARLRRAKYVRGEDLVRTLEVYFASGTSPGTASRRLGIHPNTLRQRLRRASQETGMDLDHPLHRLLLQLELLAESSKPPT